MWRIIVVGAITSMVFIPKVQIKGSLVMKRHIALIPLSHEHHEALLLARLLQEGAPAYKGLPTELIPKAEYALNLYQKRLEKHFIQEEEIIPIVAGISPELDALLEDMVQEHIMLRKLFAQLPAETNLLIPLDQLGKSLEFHIRKEERQLFPLIQECCGDDKLNEIRVLLSEH